MSLKISKIKSLFDFKKILVAIGLLAFAFSILLNIIACDNTDNTQVANNQDQVVVDEINSVDSYQIIIPVGSSVKDLHKIDKNFIENKLNKKIQKIFNWTNFIIVMFLKDNKELLNDDLLKPTTINTTISYNYGKITYQFTKLAIKVISN